MLPFKDIADRILVFSDGRSTRSHVSANLERDPVQYFDSASNTRRSLWSYKTRPIQTFSVGQPIQYVTIDFLTFVSSNLVTYIFWTATQWEA